MVHRVLVCLLPLKPLVTDHISSQPPNSSYDEVESKRVFPGRYTLEEFLDNDPVGREVIAGIH